jgi:hypothetical protein
MLAPTIVVWLVLLVLALTVVAFVSRLVEKYRLANRLSNVRKQRSVSPKAARPMLEAANSVKPAH